MAKNTNKHARKNAAPTTTVADAPVATTPSKAAAPAVVKILKADSKLRGAREAWFKRLCEYDGKPVADFYASAKETPPSVPKSGVAEKATGWFSWFKRNGLADAVAPEAK